MSTGPLRRRRGRPALVAGQRSVSLTVAVPPDLYDRLVRAAALQREDLAPYVRRLLGGPYFSTEKSTHDRM